MSRSVVFTAALLTVVSAAFAQSARENQDRPVQRDTAREAQGAQDPAADQRDYLKDAASDNQFEIQAGQFVAQRSQDPQVKQLAERLVQDHQRAQQQIQQLAQQLNVEVGDQMTPMHEAKLQSLRQKQGQSLDRCFVFAQVGDHKRGILENQWQAEHAASPQLKQFAQQQIPVLQEHMRLAEEAAGQFVPQARQASETIRGGSGSGR